MGRRTADQIITDALNRAGDSNLATPALEWLNDWLKAQYEAWDWPFLRTRLTVNFAAGDVTKQVGNDTGGGVFEYIRRILSPATIYSTNGAVKRSLYLRDPLSISPDEDQDIMATVPRQTPTWLRASKDVEVGGAWNLRIGPGAADQALKLSIACIITPAEVEGSDTPIYPNDETMKLAIQVQALRYQKDWEPAQALAAELGERIAQDRSKYASEAEVNDSLTLAPSTFRGGRWGRNDGGGGGYFQP